MYANIEELLACCDEALYRAKQTGRNRTVMYEPHWQGGEA
jgi:PleD family two-component response regulator